MIRERMQSGFRITGPFGAGFVVADPRSGFAAGLPRFTQLPITPHERELPLDFWVRIDELPVKIGYRWFPVTTPGSPAELVEAAVTEIIGKRSLSDLHIGRSLPDQLQRWNCEAAASAICVRAPGVLQLGTYGPPDPDGFHVEEAMVMCRRDRGLLIVYKRFPQTMPPTDWAIFQSTVNPAMLWDPISYRLPVPPVERRSPFVRPGLRLALLPEREAELPALSAMLQREVPPGDGRLEGFLWSMLKGSDPLDGPPPPPHIMEMILPTLTDSTPVLNQLTAHVALLENALDLKGMASMYLRAMGKL